MNLYDIERQLSVQGIDLTDVKLVPALMVNGQVVFHTAEGCSEWKAIKQIRSYLNDNQRSRTSKPDHAPAIIEKISKVTE
ncbi:hypothetical protein [uncultured Vibrio sp.]|uniref:hypothetical protein n=1 Tax=uncultured Vibrio sp. TaxID=114054 RepID=UPI0026001B5F|nr:hypothetical protein [uncultured Vibrio sp.]